MSVIEGIMISLILSMGFGYWVILSQKQKTSRINRVTSEEKQKIDNQESIKNVCLAFSRAIDSNRDLNITELHLEALKKLTEKLDV